MSTTNSLQEFEDDIPEYLQCPICFNLPEEEVYQCQDGHVLCKKCYFQLGECPECRQPLDHVRPFRCRYFERMLDLHKVSCPFKTNGCNQSLSLTCVKVHAAKCPFDLQKFGQFVQLCKLIGFPNCDFNVNNGNTEDAVHHFVSQHGSILTTAKSFQMELAWFQEFATLEDSRGDYIWTPIILDLKKSQCYLLIIAISKADQSIGWFCVFLPYPNNNNCNPKQFEIKFKLIEKDLKLSFKQNPICLEDSLTCIPNDIPHQFNQIFLSEHFIQTSKNGSLLINCVVKEAVATETDEGPSTEHFVCFTTPTGNTPPKPKPLPPPKPPTSKIITERWEWDGGSEAAKEFQTQLNLNRNNSLSILRNLFDRSSLPTGLTHQDLEWLKCGLTLLMATHGSLEAMSFLIEIGNKSNINISGNMGATPLHKTMIDQDHEIGLEKAMLLVNSGANIQAIDDLQRSVLHYAARYGSRRAVQFLLQLEGVDVNKTAENNHTPLHYAVFQDDENEAIEIALLLLNYEADITIKNKNKQTPVELAKFRRKEKLQNFLRSKECFV